MKIKTFLIAALIIVTQISFPAFSSEKQPKSIIVSYKSVEKGVKDEVYKQSASFGRKIKSIGSDIEAFDFSNEAEAADAMRRLKRDSRVAFVEYDYPKYLMGVAPNDTMFSAQW
ncbi:MAG: hypothetical protein M0R40_10245, partial [Firmicutes bacterium]|nr:hypothetical protein [Bacillota bacterium]